MGGVISVLRIFSKSSPQMKATWISFALLFSFSNAHHDGFHSGSSANGFPGRDGRRRSGGFRNFGSSGGFDGVKLHDAVHGDGGSDVFDVNFSGGGTLAPQLNVIDKYGISQRLSSFLPHGSMLRLPHGDNFFSLDGEFSVTKGDVSSGSIKFDFDGMGEFQLSDFLVEDKKGNSYRLSELIPHGSRIVASGEPSDFSFMGPFDLEMTDDDEGSLKFGNHQHAQVEHPEEHFNFRESPRHHHHGGFNDFFGHGQDFSGHGQDFGFERFDHFDGGFSGFDERQNDFNDFGYGPPGWRFR